MEDGPIDVGGLEVAEAVIESVIFYVTEGDMAGFVREAPDRMIDDAGM